MSNFFLGLVIFILLIGFGIYILWRGQRSLHLQLDGRLSQIVSMTEQLAHAQGVKIGRAEVEAEHKARDEN
jgi:ABC-type nickel/cobalt efflux system permease component RcnA